MSLREAGFQIAAKITPFSLYPKRVGCVYVCRMYHNLV
jgi:hypothetical protein